MPRVLSLSILDVCIYFLDYVVLAVHVNDDVFEHTLVLLFGPLHLLILRMNEILGILIELILNFILIIIVLLLNYLSLANFKVVHVAANLLFDSQSNVGILTQEIFRVLTALTKPRGIVYFLGYDKKKPIEPDPFFLGLLKEGNVALAFERPELAPPTPLP